MKLRGMWPFGSDDHDKCVADVFELEREGIQYQILKVNDSLRAYLMQLVDEGYAEEQETSVLLAWCQLYRLLAAGEHAESIGLLGLPKACPFVPALQSHGSSSDSGFRVRVVAWTHDGQPVSIGAFERIGGVVVHGCDRYLLSSPIYQMLEHMSELAVNGSTWSSERRMQYLGLVRQCAEGGGARMDDYLHRTNVVVPTNLDLDLVSVESAGFEVIEFRPVPMGAPTGWLTKFDQFDRVQARYDFPAAGGELTHVIISDEIQQVLEPIKDLPARRVASQDADAFLHNPYGFFPEGSDVVLPPERVERAIQLSGAGERDLRIAVGSNCWHAVLLDSSGNREDEVELIDSVGEAKVVLSTAAQACSRGLPTFRWRGHRITFSAQTRESLGDLQHQVASDVAASALIQAGEVFDLSKYSDRVVGFDGKVIHVPYVGRQDAGKDWVPENIEVIMTSADPDGTSQIVSRLDPSKVAEFRESVANAKTQGVASVDLPGTNISVPTREAESWLEGMQHILAKKRGAPTAVKDPPPRNGDLRLQILHNLESLDYGSAPLIPPPVSVEFQSPASLRTHVRLFEHQRQGAAWLQHRLSQRSIGVRGILLADDMGLGKTLQCLLLIAGYFEKTESAKPCLVVAPVSLLENWKREIANFLNGSQGATLSLYGKGLSESRVGSENVAEELKDMGLKRFLRPGFAKGASIVLTTYETLRDYEFSLARENWGIVICDEAQRIKTPGALVTRAAKSLQADFRVACTGTPVENSLADLWCLFDFFQPGLLGSLAEFTKEFRRSIELREAGHESLVEHLRGSIDPWVLRRMKTDVANLPPKIESGHPQADESVMSISMSSLQLQLYRKAIQDFKKISEASVVEKSPAAALALLHRLRMICANPVCVDDPHGELRPVDEHIRHSPKLDWLVKTLSDIRAKGEKVIIFTEYRDVQRIVQRAIANRFNSLVDIVNGSTTVAPDLELSRQAIIDRFQAVDGFAAIVLSTTAVGFGVNIQKANHVIHFTRPWNPAKEDQATDRAYRIGQTKPVWVYCPTLTGTGFESFEQRVAERLAAKRSLSHDMLSPEQSLTFSDFEGLVGSGSSDSKH